MKKMSKLILATIMAAGVFSLSGCIENLEPAGISDLRGAKAELLRAQTALQAAEAAKVQAEAALVQAQARVQEAIAKQEEAKVSYVEAEALLMKYQAEAQAVQNEEERARLELLIEQNKVLMQQAQNEAAVAAAELEKQLLEVQAAMLRAQADYEQALKSLALAKSTLTPEQQAQFAALENAVEQARRDVETKTQFYIQAGNALAEATAEADPEKGISIALRQANRVLAARQAELEGAIEAQKIAEEFVKLDETLEGWVKKQEELEAKAKDLEKQAAVAMEANIARVAEIEDSLQNIIYPAIESYTEITGYSFNYATCAFNPIPGIPTQVLEIPQIYIPAPKDADGNNIVTDFMLPDSDRYYWYGDEHNLLDYIDERLEYYRNRSNADYYNSQIAMLERTLEKYVSSVNYISKKAAYEDAIAAYNSGDILSYFKVYEFVADFDITEVVDDYNTALTAFEAAIKKYEDAVSEFPTGSIAEAENILAAKRDAAISAAAEERGKAYQTAQTKYEAAYLEYAKAESVYKNAKSVRDIAFEDGEAEAGATYADMESYINYYKSLGSHTDDQTALYNKYLPIYNQLNKVQATFDEATVAWNKASDAHAKAQTARADAMAAADKAYTRAYDAAALEYDNAYKELVASQPTFDIKYKNYLRGLISATRDDLEDAMNELDGVLEDRFAQAESRKLVYYHAAKGTEHLYNCYITNVPDYLYSESYDAATASPVYKLIPADLEKIKDLEVFKSKFIDLAADRYASYKRSVVGKAYNSFGDYAQYTVTYLPFDTYENDGLELMSYDEFVEAMESEAEGISERDEYCAYNYVKPTLEAAGYTNGFWYDTSASSSGPLAYEYAIRMEIDYYKELVANCDLLPDFIAQVEKAREDVVAMIESNKAELDAVRAEIESVTPRMIAELEEIDALIESYNDKINVILRQISYYDDLITDYCYGLPKEQFDALLQEYYEDAVRAAFEAENALIAAQKDVEDVKAGLVDAVTMAQIRLDNAEAELKAATEKLAIASAQLAAAIEAIYGTTM